MDWRKKEDYKYTEDLCPEGWAWEFLRRNSDYIKRYHNYVDTIDGLKKKHENKDSWVKDPEAFVFIPEREPNESIDTWRKKALLSSGPEPRKVPLNIHLGEYWGLRNGIHNPSERYSNQIVFVEKLKKVDTSINKQLELYFEFEEGYSRPLSLENGQTAIGFNLGRPICEQLKEAEAYLLDNQKAYLKIIKDKIAGMYKNSEWQQYLQILDARAQGAKYDEIGDHFFPISDDKPDQDPFTTASNKAKAARSYTKRHRDFLLLLPNEKVVF